MSAIVYPHEEITLGAGERAERPPTPWISLTPGQRAVLAIVVGATAIAVAAPYPATKLIVGAVLALTGAALLADFDERFLGLYVLLLPVLQLVPLSALGLAAFNWQTIFLLLFAVVAVITPAGGRPAAVSWWIGVFSILLIASATYSWAQGLPFAQLFMKVKNWLFPFMLFIIGRRCFRRESALWFLVVCVALVSFGQGLHALRESLSTSNLLRHRPEGMLTGQANLFAGYVAMYALVFLFASRSVQIRPSARMYLAAVGLLMVVVLVFTLSRGAWIAFGATAALFGVATNRRLVVLLLVALAAGHRWIPEEAVARTETLTAVELSNASSLEDSMDASAGLRIIQWKTFPQMFLEHPVLGSGLNTYPSRLGRHTGIFRSAHATMIEIGTEMGTLGLAGYLCLLIAAAAVAIRRAYRAPPGSLARSVGLGLAAATVCLFLLDFTGTRFRANTVTSYFWLLLGAVIGATDSDEAPADESNLAAVPQP
jgi:O-antigen ligase